MNDVFRIDQSGHFAELFVNDQQVCSMSKETLDEVRDGAMTETDLIDILSVVGEHGEALASFLVNELSDYKGSDESEEVLRSLIASKYLISQSIDDTQEAISFIEQGAVDEVSANVFIGEDGDSIALDVWNVERFAGYLRTDVEHYYEKLEDIDSKLNKLAAILPTL